MTTFPEILALKLDELNSKIILHNQYGAELDELRAQDAPDQVKVEDLRVKKARLSSELMTLRSTFEAFEAEAADDERLTRAAAGSVRSAAGVRMLGSGDAPAPGQWINTQTGERASVRSDESFGSHPVVVRGHKPGDEAAIGQYGDLGQMVRALTTSSGSAVVPTTWAADIIDRARNASAVMQAGATLVPMDAKIVQIGRLTGDPTAAFRAESSAITPSDPVLDNVTLTSTTQSVLVIGSLEWFQDADNAEELVSNAIAQAIALQVDLTALYGGIVAGAGSVSLATPPNPRGILAALNAVLPANVLGAAANGTTQTVGSFYGEILDTIYKIRDSNEEPNALIWNTKLARLYAKANDTTGQPLRLPADVESIRRFSSNQIPSYTQGTMTSTATDLFAADWTKLLIGQRLGLTIQTLTERYAEFGQVGIVAHWRGDIQPARPSAFAVYRAIKGA